MTTPSLLRARVVFWEKGQKRDNRPLPSLIFLYVLRPPGFQNIITVGGRKLVRKGQFAPEVA